MGITEAWSVSVPFWKEDVGRQTGEDLIGGNRLGIAL
jgi:hypothetical protein